MNLDYVGQLLFGVWFELNFGKTKARGDALEQALVQIHGVGDADNHQVAVGPSWPVKEVVTAQDVKKKHPRKALRTAARYARCFKNSMGEWCNAQNGLLASHEMVQLINQQNNRLATSLAAPAEASIQQLG